MQKYLALLLIPTLAMTAHADSQKNVSFSAEYTAYNAKADTDDSKLTGFGLGVSALPQNHGFYGGIDYLKDDGVKMYHIDMGYQRNLYNQNGLYALGKLGVGFASVDIDGLANKNNFVTLPFGVEAGYSFTPSVNAYVGAGYQVSFDLTSNTTCRDGSQSHSTGSGTCSWHGGIAQYNDKVGTVHGVTYNVGVRYNF